MDALVGEIERLRRMRVEIAYSPYISEQNGDNREQYRRNLISIGEEIVRLMDMYDWVGKEAA
ncbi:hypothetical protein GCM10007084_01320 [Parabacteroides faecis]|uniref:Uncharacterized protein n=1 Tax=Parabacteroides faecis TaxID=1217282 RepID=A0ABR6KKS7_9BACT|nr:hypothetical protein [Parabacteroides faecis]GGJ81207.1 hypothetical protein GCM10007084_01320 [Parabacteroides faecis]